MVFRLTLVSYSACLVKAQSIHPSPLSTYLSTYLSVSLSIWPSICLHLRVRPLFTRILRLPRISWLKHFGSRRRCCRLGTLPSILFYIITCAFWIASHCFRCGTYIYGSRTLFLLLFSFRTHDDTPQLIWTTVRVCLFNAQITTIR